MIVVETDSVLCTGVEWYAHDLFAVLVGLTWSGEIVPAVSLLRALLAVKLPILNHERVIRDADLFDILEGYTEPAAVHLCRSRFRSVSARLQRSNLECLNRG